MKSLLMIKKAVAFALTVFMIFSVPGTMPSGFAAAADPLAQDPLATAQPGISADAEAPAPAPEVPSGSLFAGQSTVLQPAGSATENLQAANVPPGVTQYVSSLSALFPPASGYAISADVSKNNASYYTVSVVKAGAAAGQVRVFNHDVMLDGGGVVVPNTYLFTTLTYVHPVTGDDYTPNWTVTQDMIVRTGVFSAAGTDRRLAVAQTTIDATYNLQGGNLTFISNGWYYQVAYSNVYKKQQAVANDYWHAVESLMGTEHYKSTMTVLDYAAGRYQMAVQRKIPSAGATKLLTYEFHIINNVLDGGLYAASLTFSQPESFTGGNVAINAADSLAIMNWMMAVGRSPIHGAMQALMNSVAANQTVMAGGLSTLIYDGVYYQFVNGQPQVWTPPALTAYKNNLEGLFGVGAVQITALDTFGRRYQATITRTNAVSGQAKKLIYEFQLDAAGNLLPNVIDPILTYVNPDTADTQHPEYPLTLSRTQMMLSWIPSHSPSGWNPLYAMMQTSIDNQYASIVLTGGELTFSFQNYRYTMHNGYIWPAEVAQYAMNVRNQVVGQSYTVALFPSSRTGGQYYSVLVRDDQPGPGDFEDFIYDIETAANGQVMAHVPGVVSLSYYDENGVRFLVDPAMAKVMFDWISTLVPSRGNPIALMTQTRVDATWNDFGSQQFQFLFENLHYRVVDGKVMLVDTAPLPQTVVNYQADIQAIMGDGYKATASIIDYVTGRYAMTVKRNAEVAGTPKSLVYEFRLTSDGKIDSPFYGATLTFSKPEGSSGGDRIINSTDSLAIMNWLMAASPNGWHPVYSTMQALMNSIAANYKQTIVIYDGVYYQFVNGQPQAWEPPALTQYRSDLKALFGTDYEVNITSLNTFGARYQASITRANAAAGQVKNLTYEFSLDASGNLMPDVYKPVVTYKDPAGGTADFSTPIWGQGESYERYTAALMMGPLMKDNPGLNPLLALAQTTIDVNYRQLNIRTDGVMPEFTFYHGTSGYHAHNGGVWPLAVAEYAVRVRDQVFGGLAVVFLNQSTVDPENNYRVGVSPSAQSGGSVKYLVYDVTLGPDGQVGPAVISPILQFNKPDFEWAGVQALSPATDAIFNWIGSVHPGVNPLALISQVTIDDRYNPLGEYPTITDDFIFIFEGKMYTTHGDKVYLYNEGLTLDVYVAGVRALFDDSYTVTSNALDEAAGRYMITVMRNTAIPGSVSSFSYEILVINGAVDSGFYGAGIHFAPPDGYSGGIVSFNVSDSMTVVNWLNGIWPGGRNPINAIVTQARINSVCAFQNTATLIYDGVYYQFVNGQVQAWEPPKLLGYIDAVKALFSGYDVSYSSLDTFGRRYMVTVTLPGAAAGQAKSLSYEIRLDAEGNVMSEVFDVQLTYQQPAESSLGDVSMSRADGMAMFNWLVNNHAADGNPLFRLMQTSIDRLYNTDGYYNFVYGGAHEIIVAGRVFEAALFTAGGTTEKYLPVGMIEYLNNVKGHLPWGANVVIDSLPSYTRTDGHIGVRILPYGSYAATPLGKPFDLWYEIELDGNGNVMPPVYDFRSFYRNLDGSGTSITILAQPIFDWLAATRPHDWNPIYAMSQTSIDETYNDRDDQFVFENKHYKIVNGQVVPVAEIFNITLGDGSGVTNTMRVPVHFSGDLSGIRYVRMAYNSLDASAYGPEQDFAVDMTVNLPPYVGMNYVNFQFYDVNRVPVKWDYRSIELRSTAPVLTINSGALSTQSNAVTLSFGNFPSDARFVQIAVNDLSDAAYGAPIAVSPNSPSLQYTLPGGPSMKYVNVWFLDANGTRISWCYSTINFTPPPPSFTINGGAAATTSSSVEIAFSNLPANAKSVKVAINSLDASAYNKQYLFTPGSSSLMIDLGAGAGTKYVNIKIFDEAGNEIGWCYQSIVQNAIPAAMTLAALNGNEASTSSRNVKMKFTNVPAEVTQVRIAINPLDVNDLQYYGALQAFSSLMDVILPAYIGTNYVNVRFFNAQGQQVGDWIYDSIELVA